MPDMINIAEWASDNLLAVWVSSRGSLGHFAGFDGLEVTDTGSDSGMHRLRGGINFPMPIPEQQTARTRGDGKTLANWKRSADQANQYILEMAVRDVHAEVYFGGGQAYQFGYYRILGILGSSTQHNEDSILLMHRAAQSQEDATLNDPGYENLLVFSNKITALGPAQVAQDQTGNSRYQGIADAVKLLPWGVSTEDASNFTDGIVASYTTEFPDMYHCIVGDGSTDTITVDQKPADDQTWRVMVVDFTATLALGTGVLVQATVTAVDPDAKEITVSAPLTEDHLYVVVYQMSESDL
jgi:hypothetical protein